MREKAVGRVHPMYLVIHFLGDPVLRSRGSFSLVADEVANTTSGEYGGSAPQCGQRLLNLSGLDFNSHPLPPSSIIIHCRRNATANAAMYSPDDKSYRKNQFCLTRNAPRRIVSTCLQTTFSILLICSALVQGPRESCTDGFFEALLAYSDFPGVLFISNVLLSQAPLGGSICGV